MNAVSTNPFSRKEAHKSGEPPMMNMREIGLNSFVKFVEPRVAPFAILAPSRGPNCLDP